MALHDFDVLQAMNGLARATYEENRELDPKVKQLLYIAALTVVRAGSEFLTSHIDRSLELGTRAQEILESIELALPVAGVVAFLAGFEAWCQVTQASGLEPKITGAPVGA
jgi:4-carboxymuconolactone decarboxylase